jgi:hypothetical protein
MDFKKILPVENYTLTTKLTVEEIRNRMANKVEPKKNFRLKLFSSTSSKPYEGYVTASAFKINRIISYRNSFLPIIGGQTYSVAGKTYIKIEMSILRWVIAFLIIILGFFIMGSMAFSSIFFSGSKGTSPEKFMLHPLFLFLVPLFFYFVIYFSFKFESKKSKEFLATLLEGEELIAQ